MRAAYFPGGAGDAPADRNSTVPNAIVEAPKRDVNPESQAWNHHQQKTALAPLTEGAKNIAGKQTHQRGEELMRQGVLSFQYVEERRKSGMTALAGLALYLELAEMTKVPQAIKGHVGSSQDGDPTCAISSGRDRRRASVLSHPGEGPQAHPRHRPGASGLRGTLCWSASHGRSILPHGRPCPSFGPSVVINHRRTPVEHREPPNRHPRLLYIPTDVLNATFTVQIRQPGLEVVDLGNLSGVEALRNRC